MSVAFKTGGVSSNEGELMDMRIYLVVGSLVLRRCIRERKLELEGRRRRNGGCH